jgi:hypothetical protein
MSPAFVPCIDCTYSVCGSDGWCRHKAEDREVGGRIKALRLAQAAVTARGQAYGKPEDLFARIAKRWSLTLGKRVTPAQVAVCLIDLKVERALANPAHLDTAVDIAGYAACLYEIAEVSDCGSVDEGK